jgi:hypothetical protein
MDRKTAENRGLSKYDTETQCTNGHMSERYTSSGRCIACMNEVVQERKAKRAVRYDKLFAGLEPHEVWVKREFKDTLDEFSFILKYGEDPEREAIINFIHTIRGGIR